MRVGIVGIGFTVMLTGAAILLASSPRAAWTLIAIGFMVVIVAFALPERQKQMLPGPDPDVVGVLTHDKLTRLELNVAPIAVRNIGGSVARNVVTRPLRIDGYTFAFETIRILDANEKPVPLHYTATDIAFVPANDVTMDDTFHQNWFSAALRHVVKEQGRPVRIRFQIDRDGPNGTVVTHEMVISCDTDMRLSVVA